MKITVNTIVSKCKTFLYSLILIFQDLNTEEIPSSLYDIEVETIDGKKTHLAEWKGKVLLIVNVASKCGFTSQYAALEKVYSTYKDQGFSVLAFPSNDFLHQEPGTNEEIQKFCTLSFGTTFPLFSKISVRGKEIHPLYKYLTTRGLNRHTNGAILWNFTKFIIDRNGNIIARFSPITSPDSEKCIKAIEDALSAGASQIKD